jgi:hypothetical protein
VPSSVLATENSELWPASSAAKAAFGIKAPVTAKAIIDIVVAQRFVIVLQSSGGPLRGFSPSRTAIVISRSTDAMAVSVLS